ncbi:MAG: hypothetical protein AAFU64_15790 [Bacteroidota bacterium]
MEIIKEASAKKYSSPDKGREEWKQIVTAQIEHRFQNFVLQMKIAEYKQKIELGLMTVSEAVDDMYELCSKYALAVQNDFKEIFKEW